MKYEGIISDEAYLNTVDTITAQITKLVRFEDKRVVVEEYADALSKMLKILHTEPEACGRLIPKIKERCDPSFQGLTVLSPEMPGLSNKARFAIMAIRDNL